MIPISETMVDAEPLDNTIRIIPFDAGLNRQSTAPVQTGFPPSQRGLHGDPVDQWQPPCGRPTVHSGPVTAAPPAPRPNTDWVLGRTPMNARFWLAIGKTFVKLTLKPGQSVILRQRDPQESGYAEAQQVYRNLGNGFVYHGWSRVNQHDTSGGFKTLRLDMRRTPGFSHPVL